MCTETSGRATLKGLILMQSSKDSTLKQSSRDLSTFTQIFSLWNLKLQPSCLIILNPLIGRSQQNQPKPRLLHSMVAIKDQLLVFGGFEGHGTYLCDIHILERNSNGELEWSQPTMQGIPAKKVDRPNPESKPKAHPQRRGQAILHRR